MRLETDGSVRWSPDPWGHVTGVTQKYYNFTTISFKILQIVLIYMHIYLLR